MVARVAAAGRPGRRHERIGVSPLERFGVVVSWCVDYGNMHIVDREFAII